jgi:hypothetical protein
MRFQFDRGQNAGAFFGVKNGYRMRAERHGDQLGIVPGGSFFGDINDFLVSDVHSIEVSDRQYGTSFYIPDVSFTVDYLHSIASLAVLSLSSYLKIVQRSLNLQATP